MLVIWSLEQTYMVIDDILFHQPFHDIHNISNHLPPINPFECECIYAIENITKEGEEKRRDKGVSVI